MDGTTKAIIRQLKDLGYTVAIVSLHKPERTIGNAAHLETSTVYEVRIDGRSGADWEYRAACALARLAGVDLEG